jgi:hypothetical protein
MPKAVWVGISFSLKGANDQAGDSSQQLVAKVADEMPSMLWLPRKSL